MKRRKWDVNWALREIGKRKDLAGATALAEELAGTASRSARWIGRDGLREFALLSQKKHLRAVTNQDHFHVNSRLNT